MLNSLKNAISNFFNSEYWGTKASGIMFISPEDETILLLKRSKFSQEPNTWGIPGGAINEGFYKNNHKQNDPEDKIFLESAKREVIEELGSFPNTNLLVAITDYKDKDFTYKTFVYAIDLEIKENFNIVLNKEHTDYKWFKFTELPKKLHFGVKYSLETLGL